MSPLDPVFWTHHNMLDCLWVDWNINRNNANTNDTAWTNKTFSDFFDENGNPVTVEVIATVLYPIFLYQFEACGPTAQTAKLAADKKALEAWLRQGAPSKIEFSKRFELRQQVTAEMHKSAAGSIKVEPEALRTILESSGKNKGVLTIDEVEVPEKRDFFVRVFLNKPDASAQTPIEDPHYAGSFAFFFDEKMKAEPGMAMTGRPKAGYLVDVTPTLRKLGQAGSLGGGQLEVTLVPVPYERRAAEGQRVTLGRLELGLAQF
jgi:tyrosinase